MSEERKIPVARSGAAVSVDKLEFCVARLAAALSAVVGPMANAGLLAEAVLIESNGACALGDEILRELGTPGEDYTQRLRYVMDREIRKAQLNNGEREGAPRILAPNGRPVGRG